MVVDRRLREAAWGLPVLWLLLSRGGYLERGQLAVLLGVEPGVVRRLVRGLSRRGLVARSGERICVTSLGARLVLPVQAAGRKRQKFAYLYGDGLLVYVVVRPSGARARFVPLELACKLCRGLSGGGDLALLSRQLGVAAKTASYTAKALDVLGCPGAGCLLGCCTQGAPEGLNPPLCQPVVYGLSPRLTRATRG
jgi:hypothetical protein